MTAVGAIPVSAGMPFEEVHSASSPQWQYGNTVSLDGEWWRYVMPHTGSLHFVLEATVQWPGYQQFTIADVGNVSPAPTSAGSWTNLDFNMTSLYTVIHFQVWWASVTAGTTAVVNTRISVGGGGGTVTVDRLDMRFVAVRA